MDIDEAARLCALELIVTNLLAAQLKGLPEPQEAAADGMRRLLGQVEATPRAGTADMQEMLRVRIGTALGEMMRTALRVAGH